jgi:hypothetical protein
MPEAQTQRRTAVQLFAVSFTALFLELMLIRWVPAVVPVVAYYTNLMLMSSFLGLGLGALLTSRKLNLFAWFPALLLADMLLFWTCREFLISSSDSEYHFFSKSPGLVNYVLLITVFVLNASVFVPLGERIGQLFSSLPVLRAYSWDLGGSLTGTLAFGFFSLLAFSPLAGLSAVALVYVSLQTSTRSRIGSAVLMVLAVGLVWQTTNRQAHWSPYQYITVHDAVDTKTPLNAPPPADLLTRQDPPLYTVSVNRNFYQFHGTLDDSRYTPGTAVARYVNGLRVQYLLPYKFFDEPPTSVAVVGAGGGMDVEAALISGAQQVAAVEIDPAIIGLSREYNASGVYADPRVTTHNDDARAFFQSPNGPFDLIVFGFLDSQALSTSMSSIRLDGFVYTVESIRSAYEKLKDNGMLSLSFFVGERSWMAVKLANMVKEGTGTDPLLYMSGGKAVLCAKKGAWPVEPARQFGRFARYGVRGPRAVPAPTDDWPFLYLKEPTIPSDYLLVMGSLLTLGCLVLWLLKPAGMGYSELHFMFLGAGFLLLQTKSIVDCSLYFGGTWLVTMLVIAGVLLMVLLANHAAARLGRFSKWYYAGLFAAFLLRFLVPNDWVLSLGFSGRLAWTLLAVPLPIFFAGLVFSTTFATSPRPASSFGANLMGATLGGFSEYLGMAIGYHKLSVLVIIFYAASLYCVGRRRA